MSKATVYLQTCPTCGRKLSVRVEYLGRELVCGHCRGSFVAQDPSNTGAPPSSSAVMERVDALLEAAAKLSSPHYVNYR